MFYRIELTAVYIWISSSLLIFSSSSTLLSPQTPLYVGANCRPEVLDFHRKAEIRTLPPPPPPTYFSKDFFYPVRKKKRKTKGKVSETVVPLA